MEEEKIEEEEMWDPQEMRLGVRKGCQGGSVAEQAMRLGDWIWGSRERRSAGNSRFSGRCGLWLRSSCLLELGLG